MPWVTKSPKNRFYQNIPKCHKTPWNDVNGTKTLYLRTIGRNMRLPNVPQTSYLLLFVGFGYLLHGQKIHLKSGVCEGLSFFHRSLNVSRIPRDFPSSSLSLVAVLLFVAHVLPGIPMFYPFTNSCATPLEKIKKPCSCIWLFLVRLLVIKLMTIRAFLIESIYQYNKKKKSK